MTKNRRIRSTVNLSILLITLTLTVSVVACDSEGSDGGSGTGGASGSGTSRASGTDRDNEETLVECPLEEPPLQDPYCINPACPSFKLLPDLDPKYAPKGNCCNTVDIQRYEASLPEGATYDLEYVLMVNLPSSNLNTMHDMVRESIRDTQEQGGDVTLTRVKNVPRTADIKKDENGNPIPVRVTLEMGNAGKLNCDGTYSFYGPNAAPDPIHEGPPKDPSRWQKRTVQVDYYGFEADYNFSIPILDTRTSEGVAWIPRWMPGGEGEKAKLDYEQPVAFVAPHLDNSQRLWGCQGTISSSGNWETVGDAWAFVPVKEASLVSPSILKLLSGQTVCGLFAMGIGGGDCADIPQAEWTIKPSVYCNADWYCWIGDPNDEFYSEFWNLFFVGEYGCDPNGGAYTCCDPAATSTELPACNAFISMGAVVQAAVEITDEEINDPAEAASWTPDCAQ